MRFDTRFDPNAFIVALMQMANENKRLLARVDELLTANTKLVLENRELKTKP